MTAISNLSAQFSEMLREFKKRGELYHEADDATLTTNDLIDALGVSKATLNRLRQRRSIPFRIRALGTRRDSNLCLLGLHTIS